MSAEKELEKLLESSGAVLQRDKRHLVYTLPNGGIFTMAKTPSDIRAYDNALAELRRELGIVDPKRGMPGERRKPKSQKNHEEPRRITSTVNSQLADQLRVTGLVEESLKRQIGQFQHEVNDLQSELVTWRAIASNRKDVADATLRQLGELLAEVHDLRERYNAVPQVRIGRQLARARAWITKMLDKAMGLDFER